MTGGRTDPSQDSKRRALVETNLKDPAKDEVQLTTLDLVPGSILASRSRRQGSVMNACGALGPSPGSRPISVA